MSATRPLYANPDLCHPSDTSHMYFNKKTGKTGFARGKMDNPDMAYLPVNENASRSVLLRLLEIIRQIFLRIFLQRFRLMAPGSVPSKNATNEQIGEEDAEIGSKKPMRRAHEDELSANALLKDLVETEEDQVDLEKILKDTYMRARAGISNELMEATIRPDDALLAPYVHNGEFLNRENELSVDVLPKELVIMVKDPVALQKILEETYQKAQAEISNALMETSNPENQAMPIAADLFVEMMLNNGETVWPENFSSENAIHRIVELAEQKRLDVDTDEVALALYVHIDELLKEGCQLSPQQNEFMEEMRETNEVQRLDVSSPMRVKPRPGSKF